MRSFLFKFFNVLAALLGLSFFETGATAATSTSSIILNCEPGRGMSRKEEIECACDAALKAGTIEALESFLARYGKEDSACSALATTALAGFSPDQGGDLNRTIEDTGGEGYGR